MYLYVKIHTCTYMLYGKGRSATSRNRACAARERRAEDVVVHVSSSSCDIYPPPRDIKEESKREFTAREESERERRQ
jgi:hypothetical protein